MVNWSHTSTLLVFFVYLTFLTVLEVNFSLISVVSQEHFFLPCFAIYFCHQFLVLTFNMFGVNKDDTVKEHVSIFETILLIQPLCLWVNLYITVL